MGYGYWIIEEKESGDFVGEVGLANFHRDSDPPLGDTPEVGWVVAPQKQRMGYATEAVRGVLRWARANMSDDRLICVIRSDNQNSINVATRCGFTAIGKATYKGNDMLVFRRLE